MQSKNMVQKIKIFKWNEHRKKPIFKFLLNSSEKI